MVELVAAIVLGSLPGVIWLWFYLKEDDYPKSKKLLFLTFLSGGLFVILAIFAEYFSGILLGKINIAKLSPLAFLIFALIEEVSKFLAAYIIVHKSSKFREPVEAMVYMIVAALGFATVENIISIANLTISNPAQGAFLSGAVQLAALRLVGATLLHTLTSGLVGYWWAMSIRRFFDFRYLVLGLIIATFAHMAFNLLVLIFGEVSYALLFLVVMGFFLLGDFEKLKRIEV
ncbi:PrsW family intramembrane metalloprotease [Patescibacteria group bacterium]|nr:PrsW family intramembrane metalloprotease [Patescibacteria group bacterium]MCL5733711.1 PrsW family intramembrane metalloprotease [Patescibacteria group bacterium]